MSKIFDINETINTIDFNLAKLKFVQSKYPDVKLTVSKVLNNKEIFNFFSKTINSTYSNYKFENTYKGLFINIYNELLFNFNGKEEIIIINSYPKTCRLVHKEWVFPKNNINNQGQINNGYYEIHFSRFSFNMKKNNFKFKEDVLNNCQLEIIKFIEKNHNCKINTKNLELRLKKLLLFT